MIQYQCGSGSIGVKNNYIEAKHMVLSIYIEETHLNGQILCAQGTHR